MKLQPLRGPMAELYDIFVDWPGRLARELPGLRAHLERVGAREVLDVGCGTGRHVSALLECGFEVHGVEPSPQMRAQAEARVGAGRLHDWALGTPCPPGLLERAPFDAVIAMGNVWPQITGATAIARSLADLRALLRPGGLLLLGLKAFAVRLERGEPCLPLLRRELDGRPLWFVRFLDAASARPEGAPEEVDFHMVVVAGEPGATEALEHRASRVRVWSASTLAAALAASGFEAVQVSGRLDDPGAPAPGEDVFASARVAEVGP